MPVLDFMAQTRIRRHHFPYWILAVLEIMKKNDKRGEEESAERVEMSVSGDL